MTLHTLTIPDDPAELPRWLERRLMAPDFGGFVAELQAHFPYSPKSAPPRKLFERWTPVALESGLETIPLDFLQKLLTSPASLATFQERITTDGGAYWDDVADRSDDLSAAFECGKDSLEDVLSANTVPSKRIVIVEPKTVQSEHMRRNRERGYKIWAIVSSGLAACLAVAIGLQLLNGPGESPILKSQIAWGWGKPSGLALDQSGAREYLNQLATNVEEWSLYRPSDAAGVGLRIAEFRTGCTRLMHSTYGTIKPDDKAWLLEHCREWAKRLDGHQQALDGGADLLKVQADVDETVKAIVATLREKSKTVG